MDDLNKKIDFLIETDKFKGLMRQNYKFDDEKEDCAQHTWHLSLFLLLFQDEFEGYDMNKVLAMVTLHDLPELICGDLCPYDKRYPGKDERETKAAQELYAKLPLASKSYFLDLTMDYIEAKSKEAKLVKAFDKLHHLVQNISSNKQSYKDWKVSAQMAREYIEKSAQDDVSKKLMGRLLEIGIDKRVFFQS